MSVAVEHAIATLAPIVGTATACKSTGLAAFELVPDLPPLAGAATTAPTGAPPAASRAVGG
jgi:hypothetical protein